MSRDKINDLKNIDLVAGKVIDDVLNKSQQTDVFDRMKVLFDLVEEEHSSQDPSEYFGYIMYTVFRDKEHFQKYFGLDSKFFKEILRGAGGGKMSKNQTIYECAVHIPEISGVLPTPDLDAAYGALQRPTDMRTEDAAKDFDEKFPKRKAEAFPELLKMSMYPKFYYFNPGGGSLPIPGKMCRVKFSTAMPTRGHGILLETLGASMPVLFPLLRGD